MKKMIIEANLYDEKGNIIEIPDNHFILISQDSWSTLPIELDQKEVAELVYNPPATKKTENFSEDSFSVINDSWVIDLRNKK